MPRHAGVRVRGKHPINAPLRAQLHVPAIRGEHRHVRRQGATPAPQQETTVRQRPPTAQPIALETTIIITTTEIIVRPRAIRATTVPEVTITTAPQLPAVPEGTTEISDPLHLRPVPPTGTVPAITTAPATDTRAITGLRLHVLHVRMPTATAIPCHSSVRSIARCPLHAGTIQAEDPCSEQFWVWRSAPLSVCR